METGKQKFNRWSGFTLIELSIVLVIIGLIIGSVLVGQDLIRAAAERATITQIEKYNAAANTFRDKYGYLPGDIKNPDATNFGLVTRGIYQGEGDGNGLLQGVDSNSATNSGGNYYAAGELTMFWVDLSTTHLIDGSFQTASPSATVSNITLTSTPSIDAYLPAAKLGGSNYVYVWSGSDALDINDAKNINYYSISAVTSLVGPNNQLGSSPGLSVKEAYEIDRKMDDGLPQGGNVTASYQNGLNSGQGGLAWAEGGGLFGPANTSATSGSSVTCYDNGGVANAIQQYSVEISGGNNINCALTFKMQAGD